MARNFVGFIVLSTWIAGMVLCACTPGLAAGNIDPADKYAWSTNAGWINFNPAFGGVTVYSDHLEGYAWWENIGWIRMGAHTGGSPHTYDNSSDTGYGVNHDGSGNLSGYAWSASANYFNYSK